jgi:DNA-binding NarL/FixJ family response regulator
LPPTAGNPHTLFTIHADPSCAARALQMGASGYLSGDAGRADLIAALKNMREGKNISTERFWKIRPNRSKHPIALSPRANTMSSWKSPPEGRTFRSQPVSR